MKRPESGPQINAPGEALDLASIEQQLNQVESSISHAEKVEAELVKSAVEMVKGNRRLDKEVTSSPQYGQAYEDEKEQAHAKIREEFGPEETAIKAEWEKIDALKKRLEALEANPPDGIDLNEIKQSLARAEADLKERHQRHSQKQHDAYYGTDTSLRIQHEEIKKQFDASARNDVDFAVENTVAAHQIEHPEDIPNKKTIGGKVEKELERQKDEDRMRAALETDEPRLAQDMEMLAKVERELEEMQRNFQEKVEAAKKQMEDSDFINEINQLKRNYRSKNEAKLFKDRARVQADSILQVLRGKRGELTAEIEPAYFEEISGFHNLHNNRDPKQDGIGKIYFNRSKYQADFAPMEGQYPDNLLEKFQKLKVDIREMWEKEEDLVEKIDKFYWSAGEALNNVRKQADDIIFSGLS